jgi:hypothetical protein
MLPEKCQKMVNFGSPPDQSLSTLKFQQNIVILLTSPARGRFPPGTTLYRKGKKFANFEKNIQN